MKCFVQTACSVLIKHFNVSLLTRSRRNVLIMQLHVMQVIV